MAKHFCTLEVEAEAGVQDHPFPCGATLPNPTDTKMELPLTVEGYAWQQTGGGFEVVKLDLRSCSSIAERSAVELRPRLPVNAAMEVTPPWRTRAPTSKQRLGTRCRQCTSPPCCGEEGSAAHAIHMLRRDILRAIEPLVRQKQEREMAKAQTVKDQEAQARSQVAIGAPNLPLEESLTQPRSGPRAANPPRVHHRTADWNSARAVRGDPFNADMEQGRGCSLLSMMLKERNREMVEVRGLLRACTTMWEDATQRAADSQLQMKEQLRLSQQPENMGEIARLGIAVFKKEISEANADALVASRQMRERAALLTKLKLSQAAWQEDGAAGRCAVCEAKVRDTELPWCTPMGPASTLLVCPRCSQPI